MTIGGALSDLNNLLKADDIPIYYKPSIKAVMDTITLEQEPCEDCQQIYKTNPYYDCISRQNAIDAIWLDLDEDTAHKVRDILEVQPSVVLKQASCEDCISRADLINLLIPKIKTRRSTIEIKHKLIPLIKSLKPIQPKEIYNKGWKDGAEATAYHVELCEEENPTIPLSVIEDIKADIEMNKYTARGQLKGTPNDLGEGLDKALEIIDKHISGKAESEGKE